MSPALLSQRLKELEAAGIVARVNRASERGVFEYQLTAAGRELGPIVEAFGVWGQRRIEGAAVAAAPRRPAADVGHAPQPEHDADAAAAQRGAVRLSRAAGSQRSWWLVVDPKEGVDLCSVDPGFDVDLYVSVDLRTMTAIWMGLDTVRAAVANRRMILTGDRKLATAMQSWLGLSPFAKEQKLAS